MDQAIRQKTPGKPRVLVAPLDWGLGHTTRCIPVIRELIHQHCEVILAGNPQQASLLEAEFPGILILPLPGYEVRYARSKAGLFKQMLAQAPRILRQIRSENQWLIEACKKYAIDAVISDNRFGLYHPKIPSVFITHQLQVKSGLGKWTDPILRKRNYRYINRFSACWVPDEKNNQSLAGELAHPASLPGIPLTYVGMLSRLRPGDRKTIRDRLLIVLSGPEPQRSIFENIITNEISHYPGSATIVRGLPTATSCIPSTNMIRYYNHMTAAELNTEMMEAEYVIARSGYSTIMDLAALNRKSILVPTPGQAEQEYLGKFLSSQNKTVCISQKNFKLNDALDQAKKTNYQPFATSENTQLREAVSALIRSIQKNNLL